MFVFKVMVMMMLTMLGGCTKHVKKNTHYTLFKNSGTAQGAAPESSRTPGTPEVVLKKCDQKQTLIKRKKAAPVAYKRTKASQKTGASPRTPLRVHPTTTKRPQRPSLVTREEENILDRTVNVDNGELDFKLFNKTDKTVFVACFSYIKKTESSRWHWDKSPTYKLEPHQTVLIDVDTIPRKADRENVFAILGLFKTEQEAESSTLQLLDRTASLNLGYLHTFKNKMVILTTEHYGTEKETMSFYLRNPDAKQHISENKEELDFEVQNMTGKAIFVTCFAYIKKQEFTHWRWDKSPIYKIEDHESVIVDVDTIPDPIDRHDVFGYLGIFKTFEEADDATFELLPDTASIDLDLLYKLKKQKVVLTVEQYGFKGQNFDFSLEKTNPTLTKKAAELDFLIENQTGKDIYVTCFSYENKNPATPWQFDKTPVLFVPKGESTLIDIATIASHSDRNFTQAFLAIFDSDEQEKAENATFQLLKPEQKIALGTLAKQKHKKIVLYIEHYGVVGEIIDYTVKPTRRIIPGKKIEKDTR